MRPSALGQEIGVEPGSPALGEQSKGSEVSCAGGGEPAFRVQLTLQSRAQASLVTLSLKGPGNSLSPTEDRQT